MPSGSVISPSLEQDIQVLIGDHIMELDDGFGIDDDLFDAGLDSMAIMQLLLVIEEHLGISIAVSEVTKDNFRSARTIAQLLRAKQGITDPEPESYSEPDPITEPPRKKEPLRSDYTYPDSPQLAPLTESDCFVRANERVMSKTGQGLHIVSSVLHLDGPPNVAQLRTAMRTLMERHPMLSAASSKGTFSTPNFERGKSLASSVPFDVWHESGVAPPGDWSAREIASANDRLQELTNLSEPELQKDGRCHVRCDLIQKNDETCLFVLTWRHIIFDGVGAELFFHEIEHAASGKPGMAIAALDPPPAPQPPLKERLAKARPITSFFNSTNNQRFRSLAGPKPSKGPLQFEVVELNAEQSRKVFERGERMCGPVMTTPFHAACAIRAHEMVWRYRNQRDIKYMVTVPIQMRRKGSMGPVFQNHLTMLFLSATQEEAGSVEALVNSLKRQQETFTKEKLGESFQEMQRLMRYMPPWLYTGFIRWHMRGEMTSFFFSGTGTFAPDLETFAGATIRNAYHIPSVNRPPGTGLFVNDKNGLVTTVLSYRRDVLNSDEVKLLRDGFIDGLVGEWPNEETRALRDQVRMDDGDDA